MTPSARIQAAIEILDEILRSAREGGGAADTIVARYFKTRRYAGSKDRRAIRELVFRAVRRFAEPESGRAALIGLAAEDSELRDNFDGSAFGPARIDPDEPVARPKAIPGWIEPLFDPEVKPGDLPALLARAPLDLRVNRLRGTREAAIEQLPQARRSRFSPIGLRLPEGFPLLGSEAWLAGLVEIQDEGSQLVCLAAEARPGNLVVDLCAGGGGKTLALAAEMGDQGRVIASDADRSRLARMAPRLERAGISIVESRLLDPGRELEALSDIAGKADLVLVDAPCSGSGTWRRNPETRWRLTPDRLKRVVDLQARLLDLGSALLRPGGRLVYAVCSLLAAEGRDQASALEGRSSLVPEPVASDWGRAAGSGLLLNPASDGTDGFFVARWRSPC